MFGSQKEGGSARDRCPLFTSIPLRRVLSWIGPPLRGLPGTIFLAKPDGNCIQTGTRGAKKIVYDGAARDGIVGPEKVGDWAAANAAWFVGGDKNPGLRSPR